MTIHCEHCSDLVARDTKIDRNRRRTTWVVALTTTMMIVEITVGTLSGSMALTADGWHMATHAGALLIALLAYRLARSPSLARHFSFGAGKLIPLGGYTSAIILAIVALLIAAESLSRIASPVPINYDEAIVIAIIGLVVNIASIAILHESDASHGHGFGHGHGHSHGHNHGHSHEHGHGHDHGHSHGQSHNQSHPPAASARKRKKHVHDHNLRSAFLHIAADAVTSVLAIAALLVGKYFHFSRLDPVIGLVGAAVIFVWAFFLCRDAGMELLDGHSKTVDWAALRAAIEIEGARIVDFHVWRIAPQAVACELVVATTSDLKGADHYRALLRDDFGVHHAVIEVRRS